MSSLLVCDPVFIGLQNAHILALGHSTTSPNVPPYPTIPMSTPHSTLAQLLQRPASTPDRCRPVDGLQNPRAAMEPPYSLVRLLPD
ncbi:hypothetical protein HIM_04892 [Hirsutella minnesotensis 3608]|uniref:Uncharacterized protein n=1 Tax=Hirsutella minnesotensis 3608 TaxID=1043627 RepID=A0A0F7ZPM0_9HYPO|nr:hypothetical protein HIM_04892 [Hirsutella minnesotensis 3608]